MPQSDEGRLTAEVKDQFVGRFEVEGYTVRVNGTFNPPVVPFSVPIAFLEYTSLADLNGTYTFIAPTSFVGQANINIILINASGVQQTITGVLTVPTAEPIPITGTARWFQS